MGYRPALRFEPLPFLSGGLDLSEAVALLLPFLLRELVEANGVCSREVNTPGRCGGRGEGGGCGGGRGGDGGR